MTEILFARKTDIDALAAIALASDAVPPVVDGEIVLFSGTTGVRIKSSGGKLLPTGAVVGTTDTQTLTGKTISGASNTLSNIDVSTLVNAANLTKTDDTNVTLTLGGTPTGSLLKAVGLTLGWTGTLGLSRGGTAAALTASNGGVVYSTGSALAILAGTATANQMLMSGASTTPAWSTNTYPSTAVQGSVLAAGTANTITATRTLQLGLAGTAIGTLSLSGNTSGTVLITPQAAAGTPTLTLPNASGTFVVNATQPMAVNPITGTIQINGLTAIAVGDTIYGASANTFGVLAKDTNATRYMSNTGASNIPAWSQVDLTNGVSGDLPFSSLAQGTARSVLGVTGNSTADVASIQGTANQVLVVNSGGTALSFGAVNLASGSAVTGDLPFSNLAQISGFSLAGNTTGSTADVGGFTIGGLTQKASPASTDLVLLQDQAASGALKYATVSSLASAGSVATIAGNTGAFTLSHGVTNSTNDIRLDQLYMLAYLASNQSVTTTTKTKIQFANEVADPKNWYDSVTNFRFTPLVAGKYSATVNMFGDGTSLFSSIIAMIYKNGTEYASSYITGSGPGSSLVTAIVDMNGSTDYIEGWGRVSASSGPIFEGGVNPMFTYMSIHYVGA